MIGYNDKLEHWMECRAMADLHENYGGEWETTNEVKVYKR